MKGFTLVELLVVLGISAMLVGIAIAYTSVARNENTLNIESAKIAGFVSMAKNLAFSAYGALNPVGNSRICGYGVSVDYPSSTYSIFAYTPSPSDYPDLLVNGALQFCPDLASTTAVGIAPSEMIPYTAGTWDIPLDAGVQFATGTSGDALNFVFFSPPDPKVRMSNISSGVTLTTSTSQIYLETAQKTASTTVTINGAGGIQF